MHFLFSFVKLSSNAKRLKQSSSTIKKYSSRLLLLLLWRIESFWINSSKGFSSQDDNVKFLNYGMDYILDNVKFSLIEKSFDKL